MAEGEKTEPATAKKRQDARDQGDVATSREVPSVLVLLVVLIGLLAGIGTSVVSTVGTQSFDVWSGKEIHPTTMSDFHAVLIHHGQRTMIALTPILGLIMLAGLASYWLQTGPMWASKALGWKWSRVSFFKGMKRLVDKNKIFELAKAPVKIAIIVVAAWFTIADDLEQVYVLVDASIWTAMTEMGRMAVEMCILAIIMLTFLAIADVFWTRYRHEEKLKMTKQEVRDEHKQRDGDPQIKSRMRQMQRELTRQRMIRDVAEADVVVTNPTHFSVALSYKQAAAGAPKVIAKGRGYVALRIREEARKHGIPLVENRPLAQVLYKTVEVGREVPENLYQAVAEVLAYVYRLRGGRPAPAAAAGVA